MDSFRLRLSGLVIATGLAAFLVGIHPGAALAWPRPGGADDKTEAKKTEALLTPAARKAIAGGLEHLTGGQHNLAIARGQMPASDLAASMPLGGDVGRIDPLPSTFWSRPKAISEEDLFAGFGRGSFPRLQGV